MERQENTSRKQPPPMELLSAEFNMKMHNLSNDTAPTTFPSAKRSFVSLNRENSIFPAFFRSLFLRFSSSRSALWIMSISIRWHFWITVREGERARKFYCWKIIPTIFFRSHSFASFFFCDKPREFIVWHVIKAQSFCTERNLINDDGSRFIARL